MASGGNGGGGIPPDSSTSTTTDHRRNRASTTGTPRATGLTYLNVPGASRGNNTTTSNLNVNSASTTEPFPSLAADNAAASQSFVRGDVPQPQASSNTLTGLVPPNFSQPNVRRTRPIRLKRLSSSTSDIRVENADPNPPNVTEPEQDLSWSAGRRRSGSAPSRPHESMPTLRRIASGSGMLPVLPEGRIPQAANRRDRDRSQDSQGRPDSRNRLRRASDAARSAVSRLSNHDSQQQTKQTDYEDEIVDMLDIIDPEVQTLNTLTNLQNSLFVPDLGRLINRRPTYELTPRASTLSQRASRTDLDKKPLPLVPIRSRADRTQEDLPNIMSDIEEEDGTLSPGVGRARRSSAASHASITSVVQQDHYAVLPHGTDISGWSEEDKALLDDHVRHMLHSRRSKFKRSMRAFGKYVRRPLGFFVTLYATLITLFGLAWVLFLIGWIYVGERQSYIINVVDNVLVALFAVVGDGLAPFRAVDTYHMIFIAHYHRLTWRLRKERELPKLPNHNDLPDRLEKEVGLEESYPENYYSVLTPEQQKKLEHHQNKFCKSHSFYKPHETITHHAFPLKLLIAIVVLLDCHSCLQIALGACTWAISYHVRPEALTATILSCSITVNITAGILIKVGDNRTRKKDVIERMFRQELTEEAMKKVDKHKVRAHEAEEHLDQELDEAWQVKHADVLADVPESSASGSDVHLKPEAAAADKPSAPPPRQH